MCLFIQKFTESFYPLAHCQITTKSEAGYTKASSQELFLRLLWVQGLKHLGHLYSFLGTIAGS